MNGEIRNISILFRNTKEIYHLRETGINGRQYEEEYLKSSLLSSRRVSYNKTN